MKSAPYHPASNRLAECSVQTFKPSFKKSGGDDLQQQVSQCLFQYRSTPLSTTGVPPAQLLMGRHLQTHLDLMCPSVSLRVIRAKARQKVGHDKSSHDRQFTLGDSVFAWNFATGPTWIAGSVTAEHGPCSFLVELSDGRVVKRHIDHVRRRTVAHPQGVGWMLRSASMWRARKYVIGIRVRREICWCLIASLLPTLFPNFLGIKDPGEQACCIRPSLYSRPGLYTNMVIQQ